MSACDDDTGRPSHQVSRFQKMAPISAARITQRSIAPGATTPLPTVAATLTPNPNAATKLKKAAQATATLGVSVPVDTTVATELAASWKPFRKSNTSATATIAMTETRTGSMAASLLVLEDDAFQNHGDPIAGVGRGLEDLDDLLGLDHEDGVGALLEQASHRLAVEAVALGLHLLDPAAVLEDRRRLLEQADGDQDLLRLPVQ